VGKGHVLKLKIPVNEGYSDNFNILATLDTITDENVSFENKPIEI